MFLFIKILSRISLITPEMLRTSAWLQSGPAEESNDCLSIILRTGTLYLRVKIGNNTAIANFQSLLTIQFWVFGVTRGGGGGSNFLLNIFILLFLCILVILN